MNLFTNAATVPAKETKAKTKKVTTEIEGLEMYGVLDATEKAIKALKDTYRTIVEPQINDVFVAAGAKRGERPDNFKGTEGTVTASCELRKRSAASALSTAEIEVCKDNGIEVEVVEDRPETFIFNPAYVNDSKMLEKISKAITKIDGIPADLILKQDSTKKTVVTEDGLKKVFTKDEATIRKLLSIVGTLAIKPTVENYDLGEALEKIKKVVEEAA